jgi:hypothetical protein
MLGVASPLQVFEVRVAADRRRVDIWIGAEQARSWFSRGQRVAAAEEHANLRHSSLCGTPCYMHIPTSMLEALKAAPWGGTADLPFTRGLQREIQTLIDEGVSLQAICGLLEIPFTDLWKYKFAFERGSVAAAPGKRSAEGGAELPDATNHVWERLLRGELDISIEALSLKLLVTRLRTQLKLISAEDVRQNKIRELHRFFVRHQKQLRAEIEQLYRYSLTSQGEENV